MRRWAPVSALGAIRRAGWAQASALNWGLGSALAC
jgi:hypothetical protein